MTMEEILNAGVVVAYNLALAKKIGLAEAIVLSTMKQLPRRQDGCISCETDTLADLTGLKPVDVQYALLNLMDLGYIESDRVFIGEDWVEYYLYKIK